MARATLNARVVKILKCDGGGSVVTFFLDENDRLLRMKFSATFDETFINGETGTISMVDGRVTCVNFGGQGILSGQVVS